ncbi:MAG: hypothetical protein PVI03_06495 [Candidatus Thorarchaeota archaeon]|jgi:hypothetical protein
MTKKEENEVSDKQVKDAFIRMWKRTDEIVILKRLLILIDEMPNDLSLCKYFIKRVRPYIENLDEGYRLPRI